MRPLFFLLSVTMAASAALAAPLPQPAPPPPGGPTLESKCAQASADAEYFIPEAFSGRTVPSGSGRYGYRAGCPLWIVDFSMNSKSNSFMIPETGKRVREKTLLFGLPYDLPSSQSSGGKNPVVKEDCDRLRVEYIIYTKFKHEAAFVLKKHITTAAHWDSGPKTCTLTKNPGSAENRFETRAPEANVLVIRVATRVKLRTSWQEAAARAEDAPPD